MTTIINKVKNTLTIILLFFLFAPTLSLAQEPTTPLIEGSLLGLGENATVTFSSYITGIFTLVISVAIVLAVLMIVIAGIEYIGSSVPGAKEDAKNRIIASIFGLLIALSAVLIVQTILGNSSFSVIGVESFSGTGQTTSLGSDSYPIVPLSESALPPQLRTNILNQSTVGRTELYKCVQNPPSRRAVLMQGNTAILSFPTYDDCGDEMFKRNSEIRQSN